MLLLCLWVLPFPIPLSSAHAMLVSRRQIQATAFAWQALGLRESGAGLAASSRLSGHNRCNIHRSCNAIHSWHQLHHAPHVTGQSIPYFYVLKGQNSLKGTFVFFRGTGWQSFPVAKHRELSWSALRVPHQLWHSALHLSLLCYRINHTPHSI